MAGKVEEDGLLLALQLGLLGLADRGSDGVRRLGSGDDALALCEERSRLEGLELRNIDRLHHLVFHQLADDRARAMIAQAARMDIGRGEVVAQGVHRDQRRIARLVAKVILELATRQLRAGSRLGGDDAHLFVLDQLVAQEGERDAREVGSATEAADHDVGILARHLHLLLGL